MSLMRFSKLLSKYFGINQSLCNFVLSIKGSKDDDLEKLPKMAKVLIVFYSDKQFYEEYFLSHFYI